MGSCTITCAQSLRLSARFGEEYVVASTNVDTIESQRMDNRPFATLTFRYRPLGVLYYPAFKSDAFTTSLEILKATGIVPVSRRRLVPSTIHSSISYQHSYDPYPPINPRRQRPIVKEEGDSAASLSSRAADDRALQEIRILEVSPTVYNNHCRLPMLTQI